MTLKPVRFEFRMTPEMGETIDEWRRRQPDLPPRGEAARRLIELGLTVSNSQQREAAE